MATHDQKYKLYRTSSGKPLGKQIAKQKERERRRKKNILPLGEENLICRVADYIFLNVQFLTKITSYEKKKQKSTGLPWWLSDKESACQSREHGFSPWPGKIPHAMEQLSPNTSSIEPVLESPGATTAETTCRSYWHPQALEPVSCNKRSHCREKPVATTE